jgi:hypothetical protein
LLRKLHPRTHLIALSVNILGVQEEEKILRIFIKFDIRRVLCTLYKLRLRKVKIWVWLSNPWTLKHIWWHFWYIIILGSKNKEKYKEFWNYTSKGTPVWILTKKGSNLSLFKQILKQNPRHFWTYLGSRNQKPTNFD